MHQAGVVRGFGKSHLADWAGSEVVSDGLKGFAGITRAGCRHRVAVSGGGRAAMEKPEFHRASTSTIRTRQPEDGPAQQLSLLPAETCTTLLRRIRTPLQSPVQPARPRSRTHSRALRTPPAGKIPETRLAISGSQENFLLCNRFFIKNVDNTDMNYPELVETGR